MKAMARQQLATLAGIDTCTEAQMICFLLAKPVVEAPPVLIVTKTFGIDKAEHVRYYFSNSTPACKYRVYFYMLQIFGVILTFSTPI